MCPFSPNSLPLVCKSSGPLRDQFAKDCVIYSTHNVQRLFGFPASKAAARAQLRNLFAATQKSMLWKTSRPIQAVGHKGPLSEMVSCWELNKTFFGTITCPFYLPKERSCLIWTDFDELETDLGGRGRAIVSWAIHNRKSKHSVVGWCKLDCGL